MKRVVLVAPEFPPCNTAGGHRPRLFAKHLAAFGWTPTVLTIRVDAIEGPIDPRLGALVDPSLDVIRTGALPIRPVRLIGDLGLRTLGPHAARLLAMARRSEIDALVVFGPPWFSFTLGPLLGQLHGIPYVVDYIDPWMSDLTAAHAFPSKGWWYHHAAAAIEPIVLRRAAHVTAVSEGILSSLRDRYPWLDRTRMSAMPYGAEPDDLEASARLAVQPPDFRAGGGEVTICFTGALQPKGGDIMRAVLEALAAIRASGSELGQRLRLRCYGTSNQTWGHGRHAVLPLAREVGVEAMVSEIPERIPYLEAMAVLRSCDIVLVTGSADHYYHASKLYPAIVSRRPILAICHEASSIRTVMADTGAGTTVTFGDGADVRASVGDIRRAIEGLAAGSGPRPSLAAVDRFSARASTAVLASILDATAPRAVLARAI
jgi:hypothetical protein